MSILVVAAACAENVPAGTGDTQDRLKVVTTIYPLEYFAQRIGSDAVLVVNILPQGAEPHSFEPAAGALRQLAASDVVVANGLGLEPWLEGAIRAMDGSDRVVVRALDESEVTGATDSGEALDPHAWLDPVLAMAMVRNIRDALATADPDRAGTYAANAGTLLEEMAALHQGYVDGLADCRHRTFVTAHAAFGYLAKRYGLEQLAVSGLSPEAVPSPAGLARLADTVQALGLAHVLVEPVTNPSLAETLAREVGLEILTLDPLSSLSDDQDAAGKEYPALMEKNLQVLRTALACERADD